MLHHIEQYGLVCLQLTMFRRLVHVTKDSNRVLSDVQKGPKGQYSCNHHSDR
jgi:hypothetical protein